MRAFLLILAMSLAACGGRSTPKSVPASCVPNETRLCVCGPGEDGVQACTADSVYESCRCDNAPTPDGGLPDDPDEGFPLDDMGMCVPQSDAALCNAASAVCGPLSTTDQCGATRDLTCGTCSSGTCVENTCCIAQRDADLCAAADAECGAITATDNCGASRSVASCGTCTDSLCVGNRCSCSVATSFFGQIGGSGPHEGGIPTTTAPAGNSGLAQIAAAMPTTDGGIVFVDMPVTGATVVATTFDGRANETFWLQDGVTVGHVRLLTPSIFANVRVGDRVNFRATQLENFEGHPQIAALQEFVITSSGNGVQYADRTGQSITIDDYGKIVRVAGTLGTGVSCGGFALCYPLSHGTRVITYRTTSEFVGAGDCVTFVGPVGSFPGPLELAPEPQLDTINFDWSFTQF